MTLSAEKWLAGQDWTSEEAADNDNVVALLETFGAHVLDFVVSEAAFMFADGDPYRDAVETAVREAYTRLGHNRDGEGGSLFDATEYGCDE